MLATDTSTLIERSRASDELSLTVLPSLILPLRVIALVTYKMLSNKVVLPLEYGPTIATLRVFLMPFLLIFFPPSKNLIISPQTPTYIYHKY